MEWEIAQTMLQQYGTPSIQDEILYRFLCYSIKICPTHKC